MPQSHQKELDQLQALLEAELKARLLVSPPVSLPLEWGPVTVSASEFAELESCLTKPAHPTQSIQNAAKRMRTLYKLPR